MDLYAANLHGEHLAAKGLPFTYTPFAALVLWPTNLGNQQFGVWAWNIASMLALLAVLAMATAGDVRHRAIPTGNHCPVVFAAELSMPLSMDSSMRRLGTPTIGSGAD